MARKLVVVVGLAVLCVLVGCSGGAEQAILGKWKMDIDTSGVSDPMLKKSIDDNKPKLGGSMEFQTGGKVSMTMTGNNEVGTWTLDGKVVKIKDSKGVEVKGNLSADGKRMDLEMPADLAGVMKGAKMYMVKQ